MTVMLCNNKKYFTIVTMVTYYIASGNTYVTRLYPKPNIFIECSLRINNTLTI